MKKERILLYCENCGKEIHRLKCQIKGKKWNFCSQDCMSKFRNFKAERVCKNCKNKYYKSNAEIKRTNSDFCSIDCYMVFRRLNAKTDTYLKDGSIHSHRIIAERILGRALKADEVIHHIDSNKHNNSIDNLAILPNQGVHAKAHFMKKGFNIDKYKLSKIAEMQSRIKIN